MYFILSTVLRATQRNTTHTTMKTTRKTVIALILCLSILTSCENNNSLLINNQTFDQPETQQLVKLLDKFDQALCRIESKNQDNVEDCYKSFFNRIWNEVQQGGYDVGIDKETYEDIVSVLSDELKNKIWFQGVGIINRRYPSNSRNIYPDTVVSLSIGHTDYFEYLQNEVAGINSNTKLYVDRLEATGSISPSMFADVVENYTQYDVTDDRLKLLIAIHYLTLTHDNMTSDESYDRLDKELKELEKF